MTYDDWRLYRTLPFTAKLLFVQLSMFMMNAVVIFRFYGRNGSVVISSCADFWPGCYSALWTEIVKQNADYTMCDYKLVKDKKGKKLVTYWYSIVQRGVVSRDFVYL